jgi:hypothetical protein
MFVFPAPYVAGGAAITSIVQQASATSENLSTVTLPADINAGDLLIFLDLDVRAAPAPASTTPAGWEPLLTYGGDVTTSGFQDRLDVSYRIADGTEGGTSLGGHSGGTGNDKLVVTFRPDTAITSVIGTDSGGENTSGNPAAVAVNAGSETAPLLALGFYATASAVINPRTFTVAGSPAKDGEASNVDQNLWLAWKIYISSPANVSVDMDDEGNLNIIAGGILEVS